MSELKDAFHSPVTPRDVLTFRRVAAERKTEFDRVYPAINGTDLIELVRAVELPFAEAGREPDVAGSYDGLTTFEWEEIGKLIEGTESLARMANGSVSLLGCECGMTDCWPLQATIDVSSETVSFKDFYQPYRRKWSYDGFGPFVFSRAQVVREIRGMLND